ncbi:6-phosphogluconolactonase [Mesobacillus persicus]|uniref:6-phosphogluconolactonase n=1 Tax=Mesobacillus persicus TaxID=930146 RepID=A0A1H7ZS75_9BACI|nr:lactonase family protein [Mesobacillus persicus]SEM60359.1 6-phosphogluconolactonase [Mesobacillus persicus]
MITNKQFLGFIGTYTKGDSKGIYSLHLDTETGTLNNIKVAAELENPTYLTISEDQKFLYSVIKDGENGGIASFVIIKGEELQFNNSTLSEGAPPCHVSANENGTVLSANYHKGTVDYYKLTSDGGILPAASIVKHEGTGPDPRQEKAHSHYADYTPDGKFIVAVELGIDKIFTYRLENDKLIEANRFATKPGSGPRHLVFHPSVPYAYVMTEFSSEVIVLKYNTEDGRFEQRQSISTLPESFTENNQGSAIHISTDGRFVYAANRGHDSIAAFKVHPETFELRFIEHTSTEGHWPRDFILDPTEKFLIVANQNSSNLVLFSRDLETGKLSLLQKDVRVPDPVCVKFLNH